MAKLDPRHRKIRDIADMSQFWDVDDLMRNFDEELERVEQGLGHMIWDMDDRMVTMSVRPLPITPRFEIIESEKEYGLKVRLPDVPKENVRLNVDSHSLDLFACSGDAVCRPYYLGLEVRDALDPESADASLSDGVFEVRVSKAKKKQLKVK